MSGDDPCNWTVSEVCDYVRHCLRDDVSSISRVTFDENSLATQFEDGDVTGFALLDDIDKATLRDDFGITSRGVRSAIAHAIDQLRKGSRRFAELKGIPPQLPSNVLHGQLPISQLQSCPTLTQGHLDEVPRKAPETVREAEQLVIDAAGRKRRRLVLQSPNFTPADAPRAPEAAMKASETSGSLQKPTYLPRKAVPVDEMFYGNTPIGDEVDLGLPDVDTDNFSHVMDGPIHPGLVKAIGRQIQHFLKAPKEEIMYQSRPAVVIYPYRTRGKEKRSVRSLLSKDMSRSATVFQQQDNGEVTAIRTNADLLPYQHHTSAIDIDSLESEYGYLLKRWGNVKDDRLVLDDDNDDDDDDESISSSLMDEIDKEEEETAKAASASLTDEQARDIIGATVDAMTSQWVHDKQPAWKRKHVWELWHQHHGRRSVRDALIESTQRQMKNLEARLNKWTKELLLEQWASEARLKKQCACLESTVEDLAKEACRLDVLTQIEEPERPARATKNRAQRTARPEKIVQINKISVRDFVVDDSSDDARPSIEDRLDLQYRDAADLAEPSHDAESEERTNSPFFTPESEPPQIPTEIEMGDRLSKTEVQSGPDDSADELPSPSKFIEQMRSSQRAIKKIKPAQEIIELSSDPIVEEEQPCKSISPASKKALSVRNIHINTTPLDATPEEIEAWTWNKIEMDDDERRTIIKLVYEMDADTRKALLRYLSLVNLRLCFSDVKLVLDTFPKEPQEYGGRTSYSKAMNLAGRLYLCWVHRVRFYWNCPAIECGKDYSRVKKYEDVDMQRWHSHLRQALQKAERVITIIESDDETEEISKHSPRRKRPVKVNKSSENLRQKALTRQAAFSQKSSDASNLSQMIAGGNNAGDEVAIFAPEGSNPAQHVYLNKYLATEMKPHQIDGIRFMWRELTVSDEDDGQGCILAHTMGLGKTAQTVSLLVTMAETMACPEKRSLVPKSYREQRILIICPPSLIANWKTELRRWDSERRLGGAFSVDAVVTSKRARLEQIRSWSRSGGVLLIGYTMLSKIVVQRGLNAESAEENTGDNTTIEEQNEASDTLLNRPTLVVADEAHMLKNEKSKTAQAAAKFATHRRIGLTGSPMSNETQEIYALISWVAPKYLGSAEEFRAHYAEPIAAGLYMDSSHHEKRKSMKKLAALNRIINPKLNRADITVLKGSIKQKVEFVLTVPLTDVQSSAYAKFVTLILSGTSTGKQGHLVTQAKLFGWLSILTLLCNHPSMFRMKMLADPKKVNDNKESTNAIEIGGGDIVEEGLVDKPEDAPGDEPISALDINDAMARDLVQEIPLSTHSKFSYKVQLVERIIKLSIAAHDKVLIFTHSIPSLTFLEAMVKNGGYRYGRIDGNMNQQIRATKLQSMEQGDFDCLLISTRAGGLGLNIQRANRVIIFDFGFNPTWEEQAVGRAYRLGQTKPVFVYRFVAGGTFETMLYNKALFKTSLASRVVDKKNPERNANKQPRDWLFAPEAVEQEDLSAEMGKDPLVMDRLLKQEQEDVGKYIRAIRTMETLQRDANDEPLTEEEQREVEEEIRNSAIMMGSKKTGSFVG